MTKILAEFMRRQYERLFRDIVPGGGGLGDTEGEAKEVALPASDDVFVEGTDDFDGGCHRGRSSSR